jgi:hypothetical protein
MTRSKLTLLPIPSPSNYRLLRYKAVYICRNVYRSLLPLSAKLSILKMEAGKFLCISNAFQLHCGALHLIRPALNTHPHDNIKFHKICPFYHVSTVYFLKNISISVKKTEIFDSWQRLCVLTSLSNKSFNVINSHHHHQTSSIQFIFLDKFIHLPPDVSLYNKGSSYRIDILVPVTLNTCLVYLYFLGWYTNLVQVIGWSINLN